jgi:hypothetical protein
MRPLNVMAIATQVFGRKFPVARDNPFIDPLENLDSAVDPVENRAQIPSHFSKVFKQWRRLRIKSRENHSRMDVQLRNGNQAEFGSIQFAVICLLEVRDDDQSTVIVIPPTVISAGECLAVTEIGATQTCPAMAAHVQKSTYGASGIARDQNRIFAHVGREEIAWMGNLRLMTEKQPAAGEYPLLLLTIDIRIDEYSPADQSMFCINQVAKIAQHRNPFLVFALAPIRLRLRRRVQILAPDLR